MKDAEPENKPKDKFWRTPTQDLAEKMRRDDEIRGDLKQLVYGDKSFTDEDIDRPAAGL